MGYPSNDTKMSETLNIHFKHRTIVKITRNMQKKIRMCNIGEDLIGLKSGTFENCLA